MKILALSSIRSEYDLMSPLFKLLDSDLDIELKLLVSGAHLSPAFGYTVNQIIQDGFNILLDIESLISSDTKASRLKSAANLLIASIDAVRQFAPDLILYAGDREDVMIGGLLGSYLSIPSIHFYGGDHAADGHVDNPIRHSVSKLSTFHFVSHEEHRRRLLAMGEPDWRIYTIGSIAVDKFSELDGIDSRVLFKKLTGYDVPEKSAIVIYHPIDKEGDRSESILLDIVSELNEQGYFCFIGSPNSDPGNQKILNAIEYIETTFADVYVYNNLPRSAFLALFKSVSLIIGNSSAGLLESASIPIPAINVGLRQCARLCSDNVIFVDGVRLAIKDGIIKAEDQVFRNKVAAMQNPFGDGHAAQRAYDLIKRLDFLASILKTEDPLVH